MDGDKKNVQKILIIKEVKDADGNVVLRPGDHIWVPVGDDADPADDLVVHAGDTAYVEAGDPEPAGAGYAGKATSKGDTDPIDSLAAAGGAVAAKAEAAGKAAAKAGTVAGEAARELGKAAASKVRDMARNKGEQMQDSDMDHENAPEIEIVVDIVQSKRAPRNHPLERAIFDVDSRLDALACTADETDYLLAIASGTLCAALDVLWVGELNLERGREIGSDQVEGAVIKVAQTLGYENDDLVSCVRFLEKAFPLVSDTAMNDFGGPAQHHLRDFSHHFSPTGLVFSLITAFTGVVYGTDRDGCFIGVPLSEETIAKLPDDPAGKILYGTLTWFFHLVSDMAGSSSTAGTTGGTGIPGPVLSLAKELAATPLFQSLSANGISVSDVVNRLFSGKLIVGTDVADGQVGVRMDLRGELGIREELSRQKIPVIANECLVRVFYLLHQLAKAASEPYIHTLDDLEKLDLRELSPASNPNISRLVAVACAVFTSVDAADALLAWATTRNQKKFWLRVNYPGVGHFCIAMEYETVWQLRRRDLEQIRALYGNMQKNIYDEQDNRIYAHIERDAKEMATVDMDRFGLTLEQTEILYNLEAFKTMHDIACTNAPVGAAGTRALKRAWLHEWQDLIEKNFAAFTGVNGASITWYESKEELIAHVQVEAPEGTWFRLALLETMLFEPYFALKAEEPKKYNDLRGPLVGYKESEGDKYLHLLFAERPYYPQPNYIKRLRRCYNKVLGELSETLKARLKGGAVAAGVAIAVVASAGALAGPIAVAIAGSSFAGLSGAALTSACLAYLGGGAIAAGGAGMAGGVATIVGGGAVLGLGVGGAAGAGVAAASVQNDELTIQQSTKLLVAVREIFLNDEGDVEYSTTVFEQYTQNIRAIEAGLVELEFRADEAASKKDTKEEKRLRKEIKQAQENVEAMKRARKSLGRFISSYELGKDAEDER